MRHTHTNRAFTMVELLVVVGIIGILVAILLPALSSVQNTARRAKTLATFAAVSAGLETYRNATGDPYPPSRSDAPAGSAYKAAMTNANDLRYACGANLLVWALGGRDLLGSAGFKDTAGDSGWYDDVHTFAPGSGLGGSQTPSGLYALDTTSFQPLHRRYNTFLDVNKNDFMTLGEYYDEKLYPRGNPIVPLPSDDNDITAYRQERFLLDGFGYPILYYKASKGAPLMVSAGQQLGVYSQADNALFTGGSQNLNSPGMDLGAGKGASLALHSLQDAAAIAPNTDLDNDIYDETFARFIWDRLVTARREPVKSDSYILISPGRDAVWGTDDDVTNFEDDKK
jgi:prepilin-type N-terminal cleavage/methylation domain-containing protein